MRIGIDVRCLSEGRRTGVEEYATNILENLFQMDSVNEYILFFNSWKKTKVDFSNFTRYSNVTLKKFSYPNKFLNFLFWYLQWPKVDQLLGGVDIVFFPNIIFGSVSRKAKFITTIHDLSFERYPEYFSWKRRLWHVFVNPGKICRRADAVIAVSDSTKTDIVNLYKISPKKIHPIHSAVSDKFRKVDRNDVNLIRVKEKYALPFKFILFLGTIEPRKNIGALVRAYGELKKWAKEENIEEVDRYKLVIAGEKGWLSEKIFSEIENSKFKDQIQVINYVDDGDKEYVYNLASLFVYPSFFEGFGFPPLEAMKCGVPVISSNNSSIPEVVGSAGVLIDPDRSEEIFQSMKMILEDGKMRENLMKEGFQKSMEFDWKKTARAVLDVFNVV